MNTDQSSKDVLKVFEETIFSPFIETNFSETELKQTNKKEGVLGSSPTLSINEHLFEVRSGYE